MNEHWDLILRGGRIVDGTGGPWFRADLAIKDGKIARLGYLGMAEQAEEEIDVTGTTLCPGFLDIHRHSDFTLLVHPPADSALLQGITTEVIGNCGFGPAPALKPDLTAANVLFFRPDLGVEIDWQTFGEFIARLDRSKLGVNVVPLVAHSPIRTSVMGFEAREADDREIGAMRELVVDSMQAGAFGFSSGLEYSPGKSADPAELLALAEEVAARGGFYATHVRDRWLGIIDAGREAIDVARQSGVPLQISHITARRLAALDNAVLINDVEAARDEGLDVTFDTYPYERGVGSMIEVLPPWTLEDGPAEALAAFKDPAERARIASYPKSANIWPLLGRWDLIMISAAPSTPDAVGKTMAEIASERGLDPWDALFEMFIAEGESFSNISAVAATMHETSIRETVAHELCSLGSDSATQGGKLSDAVLHPGGSYGFTARVIEQFVHTTGLLTLEQAVHKITGLPARRLGLQDRGILMEGATADVVVLDAGDVSDRTSYLQPNVSPSGFRHVLVNGEIAVRDGVLTGVRAGRVLRRGV